MGARAGQDGLGVGWVIRDDADTDVAANPSDAQFLLPVSEISLGEAMSFIENDLVTSEGDVGESELDQAWAEGGFTTGVLVRRTAETFNLMMYPAQVMSAGLRKGTHAVAATYADSARVINHGGIATPTLAVAPWPCKLEFTGGTGTVKVTGYRRGGRTNKSRFLQSENVTLGTDGVSTKNYYSNILSLSGATTDPTAIATNPAVFYAKMSFETGRPRMPGADLILVKGGVPTIVRAWRPNSLVMSSSSSGNTIALEGVGICADEFKAFGTSETEKAVALTTADRTAFPTQPTTRYVYSRGIIKYGDSFVKYTNVELTISNPSERDDAASGDLFIDDTIPSGARDVTLNVTIRFDVPDQAAIDTLNDWQDRARKEEKSEVQLIQRKWTQEGLETRIVMTGPLAKIVGTVNPEVTGPGPINRTINFQLTNNTANPSKLEMEFYTAEAVNIDNPT